MTLLKNKIFVVIIISLAIGVVASGAAWLSYRLNQKNESSGEYSKELNKIYSNGWYSYSFHYPEEGIITRNTTAEDREAIRGSAVRVSVERVGQCSVEAIRQSLGDIVSGNASSVSTKKMRTFELNGVVWDEYLNVTRAGDEFETKISSIVRITKFNDIYYHFAFGNYSFPFCDAIFSTLKFQIDSSVESAVQAQKAQQVALVFAEKKGPFSPYSIIGGTYDPIVNPFAIGDGAEVYLRGTFRGKVLDEFLTYRLVREGNAWNVVEK